MSSSALLTETMPPRIPLAPSFYQTYLQRTEGPSDGAAAASFVRMLVAGVKVEQLRSIFTSSPEYLQKHGGTNTDFVNALYLDAFNTPNRVAVDAGAMSFVTRLNNGTLSRSQVSDAIFASREYMQDLVQSYYWGFLDRQGAGWEFDIWTRQLAPGATDQTIIMRIWESAEFLSKKGP
jgi:hypothetical protein